MHVGWGTHLYIIMSIAITGKYMNVGIMGDTSLHDKFMIVGIF